MVYPCFYPKTLDFCEGLWIEAENYALTLGNARGYPQISQNPIVEATVAPCS
jgi:hypothetical protein